MHLAYILKGNLNRKQKTNTSCLVKKSKEILKTPIQKSDKPILLFNITNEEADGNKKMLAAFNGNLHEAIVV